MLGELDDLFKKKTDERQNLKRISIAYSNIFGIRK